MQNFEFSESTDRYDFSGTVRRFNSMTHIGTLMQVMRFTVSYIEVLQLRSSKRQNISNIPKDKNLICYACNRHGTLLGIKQIKRGVNFYMCNDCKTDFDRFCRLEKERNAI